MAVKLGSQVVSAGLLVIVRLLYWSLGLHYFQSSLPIFLPLHASSYRVVLGIVQLPAAQQRFGLRNQFHFPVALQLSIPAINRYSSTLRSHCSHLVASFLPYSQGQPASYDNLGGHRDWKAATCGQPCDSQSSAISEDRLRSLDDVEFPPVLAVCNTS